MKTILSQILAFSIALIFVALGEYWDNGFISVFGQFLLFIVWFFAMLAWMANYQEQRLEDFAQLFNRK